MKYFFLAFGEMSLRALSDLISMNIKPEFVITHKSYLYSDYKESFYDKIEELCNANSVRFISTDKVSGYKDDISCTDLGISVGFMEILKPEVFNLPEFGILNLHCGKLPFYKGRAPISRTIMDGKPSLFITLHKVDSGVDSGPILVEKELFIEEDDDVNTLYYKCSIHSASLIRDGFELLKSGKQDLFTLQKNTEKYPPNKKISDEERKINWNLNIKDIYNKIRALSYPYPCAYSISNGKKYFINRAKPVLSDNHNDEYGLILEVQNDFVLINCNNGTLMVYGFKDENCVDMDIQSIFKKGDKLE